MRTRVAVRLSLVSIFGSAAFLLGSCSVRLQIVSAIAEPLSEYEVAHLNKVGQGASLPGTWFLVAVIVPRGAVQKIARWELYTHVPIDDCRTGESVSMVSPAQLEGTDGSFESVRKLLKSDPQRRQFAMGGRAFFRQGRPLQGLCARLDGGSYTMQTIVSDKVPIQFSVTHH